MDPERAARLEHIVLAAMDIVDAAARAAFVATSCAGDDGLRAEVDALLRASESPDFLRGAAVVTPNTEKAGDRVGRYRLLQEIGEGGFGVVWMAEQVEPVSRRVALKITKLGMDTREVVARFEQERQALAMMDHPNIARVFDAGATASGRPFFVMELVKGVPITQFCDAHQLGTRARLALFGDLCSAINHAHQKGIIHRDIKPTNVMITLHGDKPLVKVIDFGIAKATQGRLTDKTLFTRFEQFIGTPVYMSPEQAVMSGLDVDTRSDIYALGILLYELLTGAPPFDTKTLIGAGYEEMRRIIREVEPPKPSTRLATIAGAERSAVAKARHVAPELLARAVEPDLDWIVMKAIEKDRARRYETANSLAVDIERFLANEPVSATPPRAGYRFGKFARRHKTALQLTATVAVVLIAATAVSVWHALRASKAEREQRVQRIAADAARADAVASERRAHQEAHKSTQVAKFIQTVIAGLDPEVSGGWDRGLSLGILMRAGRRASAEFRAQPEVEIEILQAIGHCCAQLGFTHHASGIASRTLMLGAQVYGKESQRMAELLTVAANRSLAVGRHEEAETFATRAVEIHQRVVGAEHPDTLGALCELGAVLTGVGKTAMAEHVLRQHLAIAARVLAADAATTCLGRLRLARTLSALGRHAEAETSLKEVVAAYERTVGGTERRTVEAALLLLVELRAQNKIEDAADLAGAFVHRLRTARVEHYEAVQMVYQLGMVLTGRDRDDEGGQALRAAHDMARRVLHANCPLRTEIARDLESFLVARGALSEAEALRAQVAAAATECDDWLEASLEPLRVQLRADPTDAHAALKLAARQAWLGQTDDWRATARAILRHVTDAVHPPSADRAAKSALIISGADAEMLAQASKLARAAAEQAPNSILSPWFEFCYGLAEFRAGHDAAAERILQNVPMDGAIKGPAVIPIYRAMIAIRAGRSDDARRLLDDAATRMRPLPVDASAPLADGGDHDDLINWLAWQEAQAMLKAK
jgi:tetratricopeptide (TPR) repeat protein